jgi:hypothetical protein
MACWRQERGAKVLCHRGRYWEMVRPGFYQCIHWLARQSAPEATWPTLFCWGYRTSLRDEDAVAGNGWMPAHLNRNVTDYDLPALDSKRRNQVRSALRQVEVVEVLQPAALAEEGHAALLSAVKRTGFGKTLGREEYLALQHEEVRPELRVVLAGRIAGKIGGYITASAVNGTAYVDTVILATEALSTNIGTGLIFELMQICRRSGNIHEVVYGLHSREDTALSKFKEEMGFPVVKIPCRVGMLPGARSFIRQRKPDVHYRLFGK